MPLCVTEYNWVDDYLLSSEAGGDSEYHFPCDPPPPAIDNTTWN